MGDSQRNAPTKLHIKTPGASFDGQTHSMLTRDGQGAHCGFRFEHRQHGIMCSKPGVAKFLVMSDQIRQVDYDPDPEATVEPEERLP